MERFPLQYAVTTRGSGLAGLGVTAVSVLHSRLDTANERTNFDCTPKNNSIAAVQIKRALTAAGLRSEFLPRVRKGLRSPGRQELRGDSSRLSKYARRHHRCLFTEGKSSRLEDTSSIFSRLLVTLRKHVSSGGTNLACSTRGSFRAQMDQGDRSDELLKPYWNHHHGLEGS